MSHETAQLLDAALKLPPAERERLADEIYRSLDDADDGPTAAEAEEIERRVEDVRSGKVQSIPGDEAYRQVMDRLRERRAGRS